LREVTGQNFGFLIAYVLPGFVTLWGISHFSPTVAGWLLAPPGATSSAASVGGFLYVTLASVGAGLTASTIRWALIDRLHHLTGIRRPSWDDSKLQERLGAFEALVENHYRYYQFYGNMLVAMLLLVGARMAVSGRGPTNPDLIDCGILVLAVLYWAGSRNTLRRYYTRAAFLLGTTESEVHDDQRTLHSRNQTGHAGEQAESPKGGRTTVDEADGSPGA
jgi:hypothetical protein